MLENLFLSLWMYLVLGAVLTHWYPNRLDLTHREYGLRILCWPFYLGSMLVDDDLICASKTVTLTAETSENKSLYVPSDIAFLSQTDKTTKIILRNNPNVIEIAHDTVEIATAFFNTLQPEVSRSLRRGRHG